MKPKTRSPDPSTHQAIINNIHALARLAEDINPRLPRLEVESVKGRAMS